MMYIYKKKSIYLSLIFVLAGIDGFQEFSYLRELGSRPFYLLVIPGIVFLSLKKYSTSINIDRFLAVVIIYFLSLIGFLFFGIDFQDFGNKEPIFQFIAQGILFLIGFSSIIFSIKFKIKKNIFINAVKVALAINLIFIFIDWLAIFFDIYRPFQNIFYPEYAINRGMPLGLFSEPSYVGAYFGLLVPLYLHKEKIAKILLISLLLVIYFYINQTKTFFVVFIPMMLYMFKLRYKFSLKLLFLGVFGLILFYLVSDSLYLFAVDENLSSAYRLGNAISYLVYAVKNNLILGYGFGSSHFIFSYLDFIFGDLSSDEFKFMISGFGENRALVFNLWIRLFVEVGIIGTVILLILIAKRFYFCRSDLFKLLFIGAFIISLAGDSYIYGIFWISLFILFNFEEVPD